MELGYKGDADPQHYSLLVARFPQYQRLYEIAEFQYFNQTKFVYSVNRSLTPMIVVLKEKLDFNSFVSPAYFQWENPSRLDMWNGTAKVSKNRLLTSNEFSTPSLIETLLTRPTSNSVKFSSHIACKERWTYPYLAIFWGFVLEQNSVGVDESFLYDKNFMCLEYENESQPYIGSGVVVEENNCNFIRGIMGFELDVTKSVYKINETLHSKEFELAFKCDEPIPANLTQFEERIKFFCNVTSRVAKTTENTIGNKLYRQPKIAASIDIADYIGWIKTVRDEIENQ
ncbi:uncharacterized protein LOC135838461 [Planococcus citri]|uniref:uncharacterized protein LOC135838461 n=1 Tax=Planococcus citri TaxID=170843 RepID=UPI0031F9E894